MQTINFTNAVLNDSYCDFYYDLWIDNERQNSSDSTTTKPFINIYNTFTFDNSQTLKSLSNITIWYPIG